MGDAMEAGSTCPESGVEGVATDGHARDDLTFREGRHPVSIPHCDVASCTAIHLQFWFVRFGRCRALPPLVDAPQFTMKPKTTDGVEDTLSGTESFIYVKHRHAAHQVTRTRVAPR